MMKSLLGSLFIFFAATSANAGWICSSFAINNKGYIATAGHCVQKGHKFFVVINKKQYPAKVVATDFDRDLAIVKIDKATPDFYTLQMLTRIGDTEYLFGYPVPDLLGLTLKFKKLTLVSRESIYQVLAGGSCQGNSGGPVVNTSSQVTGVLVWGLGQPCSYYGGAVQAQYLASLMVRNGIEFTLGNSLVISSVDKIKTDGANRTFLFLGE